MPTVIDNMGTLRNKNFSASVAVTGGSCPHAHGTVLVWHKDSTCDPGRYVGERLYAGFQASLMGLSGRHLYGFVPLVGPYFDQYTRARMAGQFSSELMTLSLVDDIMYGGSPASPKLLACLLIAGNASQDTQFNGTFGRSFACIGAGAVEFVGGIFFTPPTSYSASPSLVAVYDFEVWALYETATPGLDPAFPYTANPCPYVTTGPTFITSDGFKYRKTDLTLRVTATEGEAAASAAPNLSGIPLGFSVNLTGFADARLQCLYVTEACGAAVLTGTPVFFKEYWSAVDQLNGFHTLLPMVANDFPPFLFPFPDQSLVNPVAFGQPLPITFDNFNTVAGKLVHGKRLLLPGCVPPVPCPVREFLVIPDPLQVEVNVRLLLYDSVLVQTRIPSGGGVFVGVRALGGSVGNTFVYSRAASQLWPKTGAVTLVFDAARSDPVFPGVTVPGSITVTPTGYAP
jgi:hypothetical protein